MLSSCFCDIVCKRETAHLGYGYARTWLVALACATAVLPWDRKGGAEGLNLKDLFERDLIIRCLPWGCLVALGVSCGVLCRAVFLLCISFLWLVLLLARSAVAVLERDVGQPKLNGRPKPESRPKPSGI